MQTLKWWHGEGEQNIKVTGVKRKLGAPGGTELEEEEYGYFETMAKVAQNCTIM